MKERIREIIDFALQLPLFLIVLMLLLLLYLSGFFLAPERFAFLMLCFNESLKEYIEWEHFNTVNMWAGGINYAILIACFI